MKQGKPRKTKYSLTVGRSNTGLGLFADESIPKDSFVIEYFGPLLPNEEAEQNGGKYLFQIDKKWVIDGTLRKNIARYINHSCKPNCFAQIEGKRVRVYAKRNIKPKEELAYNYGKEYFDGVIKLMGCRCESCAMETTRMKIKTS